MGDVTLYQFHLSHYCEKIRWALDFKKIPYTVKNLTPGLHILTTRRLAKHTTVPLLVYGKTVVQDSTAIIDYLDSVAPARSLSPGWDNLNHDALQMEEFVDDEIGIHLRRYFYHYILSYDELAFELLSNGLSTFGRTFLKATFSGVRAFMKKGMRINELSAQRSLVRLENAIQILNERVSKAPYLVGDRFSRADLTAAAMLAPLFMPPEHDFPWPDPARLPGALREFREKHLSDPVNEYVLRIYRDHRKI